MKRRVSRVTRISKPVDDRLIRLEQKLKKMEQAVAYLEQNLPKLVRSADSHSSQSYTYTIVRDQK